MDKFILLFSETMKFLGRHTTVFSSGMDRAFVFFANDDRDETVRLERGKVANNLSDAHLEEFRKIGIRRITTPLVVKAVNFHKEHFLHRAEMIAQPNIPWDPNALKIPFMSFHSFIVSYRARFPK